MQNTQELQVALVDGDGHIIASQPYYDYQYGNRNLKILLPVYGRRLGEILVDETGSIRFEDNKWKLAEIITLDSSIASMNLLGKIAEAAIVRECADNPEKNYEWFQRARRARAQRRTAEKFHAIGTGLNSTRTRFPKRYNPSDPQRDIIWVDDDGMPALMFGRNGNSGIEAGLQVKVSLDGRRYILNDLLARRYEVPLVYFPLNNDFDRIVDEISRKTITDPYTETQRYILPGEDFIDVKAVSPEIFEEIRAYLPLVRALIDGELTARDIVYESIRNPLLKNAVASSVLEGTNATPLICH